MSASFTDDDEEPLFGGFQVAPPAARKIFDKPAPPNVAEPAEQPPAYEFPPEATPTPPKPNGKRHAPIPQGSATSANTRFPRVWLDDAEFTATNDDYIKHIVGRRANILIYGPSGDGKTFFTLDLLGHIATGQQWRNRRTREGLVIYVASEAGASIVRRGVAWRDRFVSETNAARTPFVFITRGAIILQISELFALMDEFRAISAQAGLPIGIIAFDTLSRSMPGGDENSAQDITQIVAAADHIRDELGASTVFVHHTGKDNERGARGHSSLYAAADTVISVIERVAVIEKSRDGMGRDRFAFELEIVNLGEDDDGEAITTCLVKPTLTVERATPATIILSGVAITALQALKEAIAGHGEQMPETSTIPKGVKATTIEQWRTQFALRYGETNSNESSARQAFKRGKDNLLKAARVGISTPYCWLC